MEFNEKSLTAEEMRFLRGGGCGNDGGSDDGDPGDPTDVVDPPPDDDPPIDPPPGFASWPDWMQRAWWRRWRRRRNR